LCHAVALADVIAHDAHEPHDDSDPAALLAALGLPPDSHSAMVATTNQRFIDLAARFA
jgi:hypothetical protein